MAGMKAGEVDLHVAALVVLVGFVNDLLTQGTHGAAIWGWGKRRTTKERT